MHGSSWSGARGRGHAGAPEPSAAIVAITDEKSRSPAPARAARSSHRMPPLRGMTVSRRGGLGQDRPFRADPLTRRRSHPQVTARPVADLVDEAEVFERQAQSETGRVATGLPVGAFCPDGGPDRRIRQHVQQGGAVQSEGVAQVAHALRMRPQPGTASARAALRPGPAAAAQPRVLDLLEARPAAAGAVRHRACGRLDGDRGVPERALVAQANRPCASTASVSLSAPIRTP